MVPHDPRRGCFFDLSDRTKVRLTGNDRLRFINGQITNDIRKAADSAAIAACVLNAKGKLNAFLFASVGADSVFLDAEASLNESLLARLERYIIADDVQVDDITAQFALFHLIAEARPAVPGRLVTANRFGVPGFDIWIDAAERDAVAASLSATTFLCDATCAELFRIEQGLPAWGAELTEEIIPVEANLEDCCIDYDKGCYIGQEVISRMKMSGQRNKSLCGLIAVNDKPLSPGMKLYPMDAEKKEVGWITSATWSDRLGKQIGLGYVKRDFNVSGALLDALQPGNGAGSALVRVEVADLPFARNNSFSSAPSSF